MTIVVGGVSAQNLLMFPEQRRFALVGVGFISSICNYILYSEGLIMVCVCPPTQ